MNFNINHVWNNHLSLPQMTLRKLANSNVTVTKMIESENLIS
jgi:hypothetical protein